jgi:hypothetical protein
VPPVRARAHLRPTGCLPGADRPAIRGLGPVGRARARHPERGTRQTRFALAARREQRRGRSPSAVAPCSTVSPNYSPLSRERDAPGGPKRIFMPPTTAPRSGRRNSGEPSRRQGDPPAYQGRGARTQRLHRAAAAGDPRGLLAARLPPLAGAQDHAWSKYLNEYLDRFNYGRARTGRLTRGRLPADILFGARKTRTVG